MVEVQYRYRYDGSIIGPNVETALDADGDVAALRDIDDNFVPDDGMLVSAMVRKEGENEWHPPRGREPAPGLITALPPQ